MNAASAADNVYDAIIPSCFIRRNCRADVPSDCAIAYSPLPFRAITRTFTASRAPLRRLFLDYTRPSRICGAFFVILKAYFSGRVQTRRDAASGGRADACRTCALCAVWRDNVRYGAQWSGSARCGAAGGAFEAIETVRFEGGKVTFSGVRW